MKLGRLDDLREALAGRDQAGNFKVGKNYASALKRAAGMRCQLFDIDAVMRWRELHPNWKMRDWFDKAA